MSLRLSLNLEQRCSLIQKLGIESDYLGTNFMVRTEYLLQKDKYEKGLLLIEKNETLVWAVKTLTELETLAIARRNHAGCVREEPQTV